MANVDVVVPCYNYGRFLESCVRSVLEQSLTNVRVLIIDDASSDDSLAIATKLAEEDRRVSVISHAENWGHILTYNQGIEWACADYFLLLSADDFLLPGALARAATILDGNPDVVLKDRNRRYETANALAMDLQRYLHDEPVAACPPSVRYRLRKFVRRNKGPVLAASSVVLALVGGIIGTTWGMIRATRGPSP